MSHMARGYELRRKAAHWLDSRISNPSPAEWLRLSRGARQMSSKISFGPWMTFSAESPWKLFSDAVGLRRGERPIGHHSSVVVPVASVLDEKAEV